jgi:catechol 2,3-dioxygenase-like lactoylglutathione lyase family enzyme
MRLDHIAYRVKDRHETAKFFCDAFGYRIQQEFEIDFGDSKAKCIALEPGNRKTKPEKKFSPSWTWKTPICVNPWDDPDKIEWVSQEYHLEPELFVSDGDAPGNVVYDWVQKRGGIGGVHHMAYQVPSVDEKVKEWNEKGWGEFSSPQPIRCDEDEMIQIFSKPHALTGMIYEFIERGEFGFCKNSVKALMESTVQFNT